MQDPFSKAQIADPSQSNGFLSNELPESAPLIWEPPKATKKRRGRRKKKNLMPPPESFATCEEFNFYNIPPFLQDSFLTGKPPPAFGSLRLWQRQLFSKREWNDRMSAVVLVPTSSGKTLVGDVAIARALADDPNAKAIFALPFVSLANEKYSEYTSRFPYHMVRPFYQNIGGADFRRGNIAVCTYEKVHGIITMAVLGGYIDQIKVIVIDEIHMLGDESRGPTIEALITRVLTLEHTPRIICLTATITYPEAERLAKWIKGFPFQWGHRGSMVPIYLSRLSGDLLLINANGEFELKEKQKLEKKEDTFILPILHMLKTEKQSTAILFVNTKPETVNYARVVANEVSQKVEKAPHEIIQARIELLRKISLLLGSLPDHYRETIMNGVAFHNAGLLMEERKLIEGAARNRVVSVLVATTTLSAGVNIHSVNLVVIHSIYRKIPFQRVRVRIPSYQFMQMIGRAGRTSQNEGMAIVIEQLDTEKEEKEIIELAKCHLEPMKPSLHLAENADRFIIQGMSCGSIKQSTDVVDFIHNTYTLFDNPDECSTAVQDIFKRLVEKKLVSGANHQLTVYGHAVAGSSMSITEGSDLFQIIKETEHNLCLTDELHMLYLCVPQGQIGQGSAIQPRSYDDPLWERIIKNHKHVMKLILNVDDAFLGFITTLPQRLGGDGRGHPRLNDDKMDRIFVASILFDIINEITMHEIVKEYQIEYGVIQSLQMKSAAYAGQISRFCELCGSSVLGAAINKFRQRLSFASKGELLALMTIPAITKRIARELYDAGITTPTDLILNTPQRIAFIVGKSMTEVDPNYPKDEIETLANEIYGEAKAYADSWAQLEDLETFAVLHSHNKTL